jgi:hypothetical protein
MMIAKVSLHLMLTPCMYSVEVVLSLMEVACFIFNMHMMSSDIPSLCCDNQCHNSVPYNLYM